MSYLDLPEQYRLSFLVGEVFRNDIYAETEMRSVWRSLRTSGLTSGEYQREFGRLIADVGSVERSVPRRLAIGEILRQVRVATKAAHKKRTRLAHDLLILDPIKPVVVRFIRSDEPPWQLGDIELAASELLRVTWRLRGVHLTLPFWFGAQRDEWTPPDDLRRWTRVAMGHFMWPSVDNLVIEDGDAPEPDGGW